MKILTPQQVKALDQYTIENEPIKSIDLMERASNAFVNWFIQHYSDAERTPIKIFCGLGNNGGDGLAVARLLNRKYFGVEVYICEIGSNRSPDFQKNLKRIPSRRGLPMFTIREGAAFPTFEKNAVIIDAIFGSGLNRPITGFWAKLIAHLNDLPNDKVAIDIPSGLFAEKHTEGVAIHATKTLSFQLPKRAFFFPENQDQVGDCFIQPIGLSPTFIQQATTHNFYITKKVAEYILRKRQKFDHKGTFGHALLMVGSYGKMGAAILATKACLRSGAGLVTVNVPKYGYQIMQMSCPEAMTITDASDEYLTTVPKLTAYKAIGIGCGIDQQSATEQALFTLLKNSEKPLVVDADALNILAKHPDQSAQLPADSILTPHPKEFERLFGTTENDFTRNELQLAQAKKLNCIIILKGANTAIACPDGTCYFNSTGNPGMATGGSGDVLTGILTGLLAQGYTSKQAAILGVYLHGLAGDLAAKDLGQESMLAGDLVAYLGRAFRGLY
ncbi:MAG: NAD(P)H-hydrate dehydratase [Bacteroidota bacterium]